MLLIASLGMYSDILNDTIEHQIMNINIPGVSLAKPAPQAKPQKPKFAAEPEDSHYRYVRIYDVVSICFVEFGHGSHECLCLLHCTFYKCILMIPCVLLLYSGGPSSARRGNDSPPPHAAGSNGLNLPFDELPAVGAAAMSYGQYNQESKTGTSSYNTYY